MPFTKGNSGNPLGRPKGSLNHSTKEVRELLSSALDTNKIKEMLERIEEPTEYINAYWTRNRLGDSKGLKHLEYDSTKGASYYISKHIDKQVDYDYVWGK